MSDATSRREFMAKATLLAGAAMISSRAKAAPGDKLRCAVVGSGGMGGYATDQAINEVPVAFVDVDDGRLAECIKKATDKGKQAPKGYSDYRKMIDECANDIDVVLISTPDHHHGPAAIRAMNAGKHVFVQKPMGHNIRECYELAKAAKEKKVLTQMGNQGHTGESLRVACEYLQAGCIGGVVQTHTILGRNFGGTGKRPASKPVPAGLHWDEWIGAAPFRDYHDGLHPFSWRSWRDFGTGTIGDMACHNLDCLFFALKVYEAKSYTIECLNTNGGSEEMWGQDNIVKYTIPARGDMPKLESYVYDHAGLAPDIMKQIAKDCELKIGEETYYVGGKGYFMTGGTAGQARILPLDRGKDFEAPPKTMARAHGGPIEDLFYCIKNGGTPVSNFIDAAGPLTAFALTGHLAQRAGIGKPVEWDVEKMTCTNAPDLNQYVGRTYRPGWEV